MYSYESFFIYTFFSPVITTNIHCYLNIFYDFKILMKVIKTETFNIDLTFILVFFVFL